VYASRHTISHTHLLLTQILGRASELNSFVKIGATDGYIEIELKGRIGKKNLVVRRSLSSSSKGSTYTLNGHSATGREVTQKMNELNVQVGNLWYASIFIAPQSEPLT
jgi:chromosome segregation ATPase